MPHRYDIAVLGATPTGLAAAVCAAKSKLDVIVLKTPGQTAAGGLCDWVSAKILASRKLPRSLSKAANAAAFKRVVYYDTGGRQAQFVGRKTVGYLLSPDALSRAFCASATKAGVTVRTLRRWPTIELGEDAARLDERIEARLLLIAQKRPAEVCADLSLSTGALGDSGMLAAALDVPLRGRTPANLAAALHVYYIDETVLGVFFTVGSRLHLRLVGSTPDLQDGKALSAMVTHLQQAGVLPEKLPLDRATGAQWFPPAGTAMEMETHVAKRCLLIGTAGGFCETITGHTIQPGIQSGLVAAEVAVRALASPNPQSVLMSFKTAWRKTLADYIRPPNTAMSMLMPLLFVNNRIVGKFTDAVIDGANI